VIDIKSIPFELVNFRKLQFENAGDQQPAAMKESVASVNQPAASREPGLKSVSIDAEYEWILETLKKVDFNKSKAAKLLKIDRKTLYNKIKQYKDLNNQEM
jgi:two-component system response regulator HydG